MTQVVLTFVVSPTPERERERELYLVDERGAKTKQEQRQGLLQTDRLMEKMMQDRDRNIKCTKTVRKLTLHMCFLIRHLHHHHHPRRSLAAEARSG